MLFEKVIGQKQLKRQLIQLVRQNRISHALLLSGSPGSGNFPLALAFAQYIQCSDRGEEDACGRCASCVQASKLVHPDIHFVFPVARVGKVQSEPMSDDFLDPWRSYLLEHPYPDLPSWYGAIQIENQQAGIFTKEAQSILRKLSFKAFESDYKVVIVWMPEKMNLTAANKLLKILEEPPEKTVFLMVTNHPGELLPTIFSRSQHIKVPRIAREDLRTHLELQFPDLGDGLTAVVGMAQGDYLGACELIENTDQATWFREKFIAWMRLCYRVKYLDLEKIVSELASLGRERQKAFLQYGLYMVRNNLMLNQGMNQITLMNRDEMEFSERFSRFIHPVNAPLLLSEFQKAYAQIGMNANPRILFTDLSLQVNRHLSLGNN